MSGLGKGVVSSSIAKLLQLSDQKVSCVKIDPYLNYDAGTMNPVAHGEVFVTEDGGECDKDIGNYERFLNQDIPKSHNITTAQVYSSVIEAERKGEYLGACVQIIPHVTDEIKRRIRKITEDEKLDFLMIWADWAHSQKIQVFSYQSRIFRKKNQKSVFAKSFQNSFDNFSQKHTFSTICT